MSAGNGSEPAPRVLHEELYALVVYLHATCNSDLLDAIAAEQLSYSQIRLLGALRGGRIRPTMSQAGQIMKLGPSQASRSLHELARRGLIRRENDDDDFRAKRIMITPRGEDAIGRLYQARLGQMEEFAAGLNGEEREQLERALGELLKREQIAACKPATQAA